MTQTLYAIRHRRLTPNDTGFIRHTTQTCGIQVRENIADLGTVLKYLNTYVQIEVEF